jgi:ABC-type phosphate transport system auxiliary subunit
MAHFLSLNATPEEKREATKVGFSLKRAFSENGTSEQRAAFEAMMVAGRAQLGDITAPELEAKLNADPMIAAFIGGITDRALLEVKALRTEYYDKVHAMNKQHTREINREIERLRALENARRYLPKKVIGPWEPEDDS